MTNFDFDQHFEFSIIITKIFFKIIFKRKFISMFTTILSNNQLKYEEGFIEYSNSVKILYILTF